MAKPESTSEIHRLGGFVNEQHDGRKDLPATGTDLYNLAVQLDSSFASLRSDIGNLRTESNAEFGSLRSDMTSEFKLIRSDMTSEFKAVRAEMASEFKSVRSEMTSEFKAVRSEMKEGFAQCHLEISQIPYKTAGWVATIMIGIIGACSAIVGVAIAVL